MRRFLRWLMVLVMVIGLSACGGGGGASNASNDKVEVKNNVVIPDEETTSSIQPTEQLPNGNTKISLSSDYATKLKKGKILSIAPGTNGHFPLGLSGRIVNIDSGKAELEPVTFADIFSKAKSKKISKSLSEAKIVGVIGSGFVVSSGQAKMIELSQTNSGYHAKLANGQIAVNNYASEKLGKVYDINGGKVKIKFETKLSKLQGEKDKRTNTWTDYQGSGKLLVSIEISKLIVSEEHDIDVMHPAETELDFSISGDISAKVELKGKATLTAGRYNHAWNEVKKTSIGVFGASAEIIGLDTKDKVGKMPMIGLVYSFLGAHTASVGGTQSLIRAAKSAGFILWINLLGNGKIELNGKMGLATNFSFEAGAKKQKNSSLVIFADKKKITGKRVFEAPYVEGKMKGEINIGASVEVDFLMGGIRVFNSAVTGKINITALIGTARKTSWGADDFGSNWSVSGSPACIEGRMGFGDIFSSDIKLGYRLKIGSGWNSNSEFNYNAQVPKKSEVESTIVGWHGSWYTAYAGRHCYGFSAVFKTTPSSLDDFKTGNIEIKTTAGVVLTSEVIHYNLYDSSRNKIKTSDSLDELTELLAEGEYEIEAVVVIDEENDVYTSIRHAYVVTATSNQPPVANAGTDFSVEENASVALDGSASTDTDGTIDTWLWKEGANAVGHDATVTLSGVGNGRHTYTLTVTDDNGSSASDSVVVTVGGSNATTHLKKTGQTKSYDEDGNEVTDGSVKDDGYYQAGVDPSYTRDDTKQIVTDHITGLEWQDDEEANSTTKQWLTDENYDKCTGSNGQTQDDAACYDTEGDTAMTYCSNLSLNGDGWRLPYIEELESIVDYSRDNFAIDPLFKNVQSPYYWSYSSFIGYSYRARVVDFGNGYNQWNQKNKTESIRCVR